MKRQLQAIVVCSFLGLLAASSARADIPPADACDAADEGQACDNAMQSGQTVSGTCQKDQCTRQTPSGPMTYDCHLCKPGAAPSTNDSNDSDDDGGCSVAGAPGNVALAGLPLLGLGLLWSRRRRARNK